MTPYDDKTHRIGCGCQHETCTRDRARTAQLLEAEREIERLKKRHDHGAINAVTCLTSNATDRSGHGMATSEGIKTEGGAK